MHDIDDDSALLRQQKQFLQQVEFALRKVNREVIHTSVPDLNRDSFVRFAEFVARARAEYLRCALALVDEGDGGGPDDERVGRLRRARVVFEESRDAFVALERAIEQGYVDIKV